MKNSISQRSKLLYEFIDQMIAKRLIILAEQQVPPAPTDPNAALMPPGTPAGVDPMAGGAMPPDPNAMPPADPGMAGMDPNDPTMEPGAEEAEGESGGEEEAELGDPDSFVVDKIKELVDENENIDATELFNAAKGHIQDQKLLDPKKIHQALSIVEKLREEENPKLDDVANAIEEFLTNEFDI